MSLRIEFHRMSLSVALSSMGVAALTAPGCGGGSASPDASVDAGMSATITHRESRYFVPSNQTVPSEACDAATAAAEALFVTNCECDPAFFGAESPEECPAAVAVGRDVELDSALWACVAGSFDEAALLAGVNEAISYTRTTVACYEAEGSGACTLERCRFAYNPQLTTFQAAVDACVEDLF